MRQENGADPQPVRHVHVAKCLSKAISDDGKQAAFQFETPDGESVFLTVDVGALKTWRQLAVDAVNDAQRLSLNPGSAPYRQPTSFGIASNPNFRGHVFLSFDPEQQTEAVFLLPDDAALNMSTQLRKEALGHMTPEQRARELGKLKVESAFGRIILPGGR